MASNYSSQLDSSDKKTSSSSLIRGEGRAAGPLAAERFSGGVDYRELRERMGMRAVLDLLGWTAVAGNGPQLRGPCPIHRSANPQSRNFSVHVEKGVFRCFGCGKHGNQLDLFAAALKLPIYAAAVELCRRLDVELPMNRQ